MIAISEAKSLDKWRIQYKEPLEIAKSHIKSGKGPKNGTSISEKRRKEMLRFDIECVHCGMLLNNGNHNTEHILDKSLGGDNTDKNRMLMCASCNSWRNGLKAEFLKGGMTIKNWPNIEKYILWNFVTVDYGHKAGQWIPEVHETFLLFRFKEHRDFDAPGKIWFARAADSTPKEINQIRERTSNRVDEKTPFFTRAAKALSEAKSWLSGSSHDKKRAQQLQATASLRHQESAEKSPHNAEQVAKTKEEQLALIVRPHLPDAGSEMNLSNLSSYVQQHDEKKRSLKQIAIDLGFSKSWTLTKLLTNVFDEKVSVRKDGNVNYISITNSIVSMSMEGPKETKKSVDELDSERQRLVRARVGPFLPMPGAEMLQSKLSSNVKQSDEQSRSIKQIAVDVGYPKRWTVGEVLGNAFGDYLNFRYSPPSTDPHLTVVPEVLFQSRIKNFSSNNSGFRMPRAPWETGQLLTEFNRLILENHDMYTLRDALHEKTGISKKWVSGFLFMIKSLQSPVEEIGEFQTCKITEFIAHVAKRVEEMDSNPVPDWERWKIGYYLNLIHQYEPAMEEE